MGHSEQRAASPRLHAPAGVGRSLAVAVGGLAGSGLGLLLGSALRLPLSVAIAGAAAACVIALLLVRRTADAPRSASRDVPRSTEPAGPSGAARASAPPAVAGPLGGQRVLLLAGPEVATSVLGLLEGWGARAERVDSTSKAFARLREGARQGVSYDAFLVERERLDREFEQLAPGRRGDGALRGVRVILLDRYPHPATEATDLRSGYSAVLRLPIDKLLLFGALRGAAGDAVAAPNTVSLAAYYRQRLGSRRLRALVADDNPISRNVLREVLEGADYEVQVAGDGEVALAVLEHARPPPDLILLDVQMPGCSGLDVLRAYRFTHPHSTTPILMVTAEASAEVREACLRSGAHACLEKPVDPGALLGTLARLVAGLPAEARRPSGLPVAGPGERAGPTSRARLDETTLEGLIRLGRDPNFLRALAEGFIREGTQHLERIRGAFADGDQALLLDVLQTLKGSAGDIGAREVASLCERVLEVPASRLDSPRVALLVEALTRTFDATCVALGEYLERQEGAVR